MTFIILYLCWLQVNIVKGIEIAFLSCILIGNVNITAITDVNIFVLTIVNTMV